MKKIVLSIVAMSCVSSFAIAGGDMKDVEPAVEPVIPMVSENNSGPYLGLALSTVSVRPSSESLNFISEEDHQDRLGNIVLVAGYNFNEYFAIEGRYTDSIVEEDIVEMDGWSIFAKPQYPINEDFSIYGLLGYGNVNVNSTPGTVWVNTIGDTSNVGTDESGFQWGLGVSYNMMENISLYLDYTSLADGADGLWYYNGSGGTPPNSIDVDALTFGVNYQF